MCRWRVVDLRNKLEATLGVSVRRCARYCTPWGSLTSRRGRFIPKPILRDRRHFAGTSVPWRWMRCPTVRRRKMRARALSEVKGVVVPHVPPLVPRPVAVHHPHHLVNRRRPVRRPQNPVAPQALDPVRLVTLHLTTERPLANPEKPSRLRLRQPPFRPHRVRVLEHRHPPVLVDLNNPHDRPRIAEVRGSLQPDSSRATGPDNLFVLNTGAGSRATLSAKFFRAGLSAMDTSINRIGISAGTMGTISGRTGAIGATPPARWQPAGPARLGCPDVRDRGNPAGSDGIRFLSSRPEALFCSGPSN